LAGGLAFTFLVAAYGVGDWRRNKAVAAANAALQEEVAVRKRAEAAAAAASEAKSGFLASMSHEIRTPLNAILGYTQLMQRDQQLSADQREALSSISASGGHLLGLVNEILDFSKIEAGRMELSPMDFDLECLAGDLAATFRPLCAQKKIRFRAELAAAGRALVHGDEGKLRQILINLIGNAVKFTPAGEVVLFCQPSGPSGWLFEVVDTGPGIPEHEQADIFKPFHQGSGARNHVGTGLGLAIAQRQVELLGGKLELESHRSRGSRFFFRIPLGPAPGCVESDHRTVIEDPEPLSMSSPEAVPLPEALCARLAEAAELHSTTALKTCLQDLRLYGPGGARLAEDIRLLMHRYDMEGIPHLLLKAARVQGGQISNVT
jgi:signal transduction histidine kinase